MESLSFYKSHLVARPLCVVGNLCHDVLPTFHGGGDAGPTISNLCRRFREVSGSISINLLLDPMLLLLLPPLLLLLLAPSLLLLLPNLMSSSAARLKTHHPSPSSVEVSVVDDSVSH